MAASRNVARRHERITCKHINYYMRMVESGEIVVCLEQHLLVAYVRSVFAEEELVIDTERDARYAEYERYFPFDLFPWEWFLHTLFFCVFKKDGRPRWPELLIMVGRGSGKNAFAAFESFCAITSVNGIREYNVDICANTEDQAKTSFVDIHNTLETTEHRKRFRRGFQWTKTYIKSKSTLSEIRYRTDNPSSKDGLRSGMVIFDEVHAYTDWKNIDVFTTGLGKKPHPRILYITTNGDVRDGVLDSLLETALKILRREVPDNGMLPFICRLDNKDEVHNEAMWPKANPSLIYRPDLLDEMRREYVKYAADPAKYAGFMTKRMNLPEKRQECAVAKWDDIKATDREVPDLSGGMCVVGIDYAKTTDFVSAFALFRDFDGGFFGIHHSWFCTNSADAARIKFPFEEAVEEGKLTIVDKADIHPHIVADWVYELSRNATVKMVGIDQYRHTLLAGELEEVGFSLGYGNLKMTRPSDIMRVQPKINSVLVNHGLAVGSDKLFRWFMNNTKLEPAPNNNFKYGKIEERSRKTDGFMAFVAAMCVEDALPEYVEPVFAAPIIFK